MKMVSLCIISLLLGLISTSFALNRPIIGILTQPTDGVLTRYGTSYIAASYVKYLEGGGARVVPVFHNATEAELDAIFDSINGLLLPGGGSDLSNGTTLFKAGHYLYNKVLAANDNGDYFPLVGHCMGFEFLALITSRDPNILSPVDAENISMPLVFTKNVATSRWLGNAPQEIVQILSSESVTLNNHQWAVYPNVFADNAYLPNFYNVLSTNQDREGREFISLWESFKYPVYGAQWHSEKPQYEWNAHEDINHSFDAIRTMQYFAQFFVNEAKKSDHAFPTPEAEYASLIYNYNAIYTEEIESDFEQVYAF